MTFDICRRGSCLQICRRHNYTYKQPIKQRMKRAMNKILSRGVMVWWNMHNRQESWSADTPLLVRLMARPFGCQGSPGWCHSQRSRFYPWRPQKMPLRRGSCSARQGLIRNLIPCQKAPFAGGVRLDTEAKHLSLSGSQVSTGHPVEQDYCVGEESRAVMTDSNLD